MKFGACIGFNPEQIKLAAEFGFDYLEAGFAFFAKESDEQIEAYCKCLSENGIKCEASNCFIPGDLKVTGETVDYEALRAYIEKGMSRGIKAGLKTVVFGSGGARSIPEGFPYNKAAKQIAYFLKEIVAPLAEKYGLTVVVEPLCDCNIINTVKEGCIFAAMAESDNVKGLGDSFHMYTFGDKFENIKDVKGFLGHAHTAEPTKRVYPYENDGADYKTFLDALKFAGCPRCSIEARCDDFEKEGPVALAILKKAAE